MKYFKHLTAVAFVALFTNFSYADDISGMIFQGNEIDDALIVNSTVTLTKQTKSANIQKTKSERDIDLFIEKAKNDAAKKEEEKLRKLSKKLKAEFGDTIITDFENFDKKGKSIITTSFSKDFLD